MDDDSESKCRTLLQRSRVGELFPDICVHYFCVQVPKPKYSDVAHYSHDMGLSRHDDKLFKQSIPLKKIQSPSLKLIQIYLSHIYCWV